MGEQDDDLPSNGPEPGRPDNIFSHVGLPVLINDICETHTENRVEDDVGGIEERLKRVRDECLSATLEEHKISGTPSLR